MCVCVLREDELEQDKTSISEGKVCVRVRVDTAKEEGVVIGKG